MSSYFQQVPNFEYANATKDGKNISDYSEVKNLFKRGKLRDDIFGDLSFFTKYQIIGDERPDNIAYERYGDETLDWVVLLSNNILNIQTEWPMTQQAYYDFLIMKYGSEENLNKTHHHETIEVKNSSNEIIVRAGLTVKSDYSVDYYDFITGTQITATNITTAITNKDYENKIQDAKRNIFLLKPEYLNVIMNDMKDLLKYKKGGTQYVSPTLKRADNIRLFQ
jgi:hypothetical protein|tara:strand:- start:308 stop:976 length:669 start_codon:yes stop_codon:yes gene_type:complete